MDNRNCKHCEEFFQPRPQNPQQSYCTKSGCQRARKRRWQREKLKSDSDYRENQRQAQKRWQERHPDYWKKYRANHAGYADRNRELQRERNARRHNLAAATETENDASMFAKMDASTESFSLSSGTYKLVPVNCKDGRINDAFICKISRLAD